ncbi:MAG: methylenetetrahydrofolate reductase C-terminal domain-containing protein [Lachnospiraceae bacterium]|nr:methylenetetrahydrofolate reductase C-terminal domain-containing protein [Lachnospiraceae bacterium]
MLITQLKAKESIDALVNGKAFIINCFGCKEVHFPEQEAISLQKEMADAGRVTGTLTMDYICNPDNLKLHTDNFKAEIDAADIILVFACGVGVQTVSDLFADKKVYAACDTYRLPGYQGVTPQLFDCDQCGMCFLNGTGGICPLTACSKGLVNGQCGGAKNGMCEVDPEMECGWERIQKRLTALCRIDVLKNLPVQIRDYSTDDATKECKETE